MFGASTWADPVALHASLPSGLILATMASHERWLRECICTNEQTITVPISRHRATWTGMRMIVLSRPELTQGGGQVLPPHNSSVPVADKQWHLGGNE